MLKIGVKAMRIARIGSKDVKNTTGFTIVELIIVIIVIGILASIVTVGYGAWQRTTISATLKSDLNGVSTAMTNYINFNNTYPNSLPESFEASDNSTISLGFTSDTFYCATATSSDYADLSYYITNDMSEPAEGTCNTTVSKIESSALHTCVLTNANNVYCWGDGSNGKLGNGTYASSNHPVSIDMSGALSGKSIKDMSVGGGGGCVITTDGLGYCWGTRTGDGTDSVRVSPVAIDMTGALNEKTLVAISAGSETSCAIASDNQAYCWGVGSDGRLGNNGTTNQYSPVAVYTSGSLSGKTVKQISASGPTNCLIASDDNAYCWGYNDNGAVGDGSNVDKHVPTFVDLDYKTIVDISPHSSASCAVNSIGKAYCWGGNTHGQLGNNSNVNSYKPVSVYDGLLSGKKIVSISSSGSSVCAVSDDNGGFCWGYNGSGELGNNSTTESWVPVAIYNSGVLNGKGMEQISISYGGDALTCGIATDDKPYCWGSNINLALGNGTSISPSLVPSAVMPIE